MGNSKHPRPEFFQAYEHDGTVGAYKRTITREQKKLDSIKTETLWSFDLTLNLLTDFIRSMPSVFPLILVNRCLFVGLFPIDIEQECEGRTSIRFYPSVKPTFRRRGMLIGRFWVSRKTQKPGG